MRPRDVASAALEERAPRCIDLIREEVAAIAELVDNELGARLALVLSKIARRVDELQQQTAAIEDNFEGWIGDRS